MLKTLTDAWSAMTLSSFSLQDVEGFPYSVYEEQLIKYEEAERWFQGLALEDQPGTGEDVDLYPMRINPLKGTVLKHAYILFGETQDDGRPLVVPKLIPATDSEKELIETGEEKLNLLWWENNGRSLMMENAIMSQIYGGSVLKASWVPWEDYAYGGWRSIPIRIERVNPKNFIGVPDGSDMYRLAEAWMVKRIYKIEAQKWGYTGDEEIVWRVEHWTQDNYRVLIDGKLAIRRMKGSDPIPLGGVNPFGFVPVVYIPHIRTGDFYGINTFDHLKGLVKELNLRFGDFGDAVNDDAHSYVAYRNVQGSPQIKKIGDGVDAIDLGSATAISGNEPEPDMFEIRKQRASQAMEDLIDAIYKQYRRDAFVPGVAEGEDEGSQRSGLTLAIRFWPLTSHVSQERLFWSDGLDVFQSYLLKMMARKKIAGITEKHTRIRIKQKWAPLLPRDREVDVQEWVQRAAANLGSIDTLLELTGDIEDIDDEKKKIMEWTKEMLKLEKEFAPQPMMGAGGGSNKPGGGKPKPGGGGSSATPKKSTAPAGGSKS